MFAKFFRGIRLSVLDFLDSSIISIKFSASQKSDRTKKSFIIREGGLGAREAALNIV